MFEPEQTIEFHYPDNTFVGRKRGWRLRKVSVRKVRDLLSEPITVNDWYRRPHQLRGRYLITAIDHDNGKLRQFYPNNCKEWWHPALLKLGLYTPFSRKPEVVFKESYGWTVHQRSLMNRAIEDILQTDLGCFELKIYCDDLRLIRG